MNSELEKRKNSGPAAAESLRKAATAPNQADVRLMLVRTRVIKIILRAPFWFLFSLTSTAGIMSRHCACWTLSFEAIITLVGLNDRGDMLYVPIASFSA